MRDTSQRVERLENTKTGAWAELRYDRYTDTWFARVYAADFPAHLSHDDIGHSNATKARAVRSARQWIKGR